MNTTPPKCTVCLHCKSAFNLTTTMTFDLWTFQQCTLMWWMLVSSLTKHPTPSRHLVSQEIGVNRWSAISRKFSLIWERLLALPCYHLENFSAISTHTRIIISGKFRWKPSTKNADNVSQNFLDMAMTLTFDFWPWKLFQQCSLTWYIFVPINSSSNLTAIL